MFYNFCRGHQSLWVTPAMEAALADHVWTVEELVALLPEQTVAKSTKDRDLLRKGLGREIDYSLLRFIYRSC
jgi:hypothetical protein